MRADEQPTARRTGSPISDGVWPLPGPHTDLAPLTLSAGSLATRRSPDKHGSKLTIAPLVGRS